MATSIDEINRVLDELGRGFVGERINKGVLGDLTRITSEHLTKITPNNSVEATGMWNKMTLKEKVKWWVCFSLFPSIGAHIVEQRGRLLQALGPDHYPPPNPYWAEEEPKCCVVADISLTVPKPVTR